MQSLGFEFWDAYEAAYARCALDPLNSYPNREYWNASLMLMGTIYASASAIMMSIFYTILRPRLGKLYTVDGNLIKEGMFAEDRLTFKAWW
jgi:hypothetical protein